MNQIRDYDKYTARMSKSYEDKLFFLDKIEEIKHVVDFGCADGTLIDHMSKIMKNTEFIGYDIDGNMIKIAKSKYKHKFLTDFNKCICDIDVDKSLLNLSSVIHEVYSYSSKSEVDNFWDRVLNSGFKYITIRDLCISENANRKSDTEDIRKVYDKADKIQLREYESLWGSIEENRNLLHFLMKYKYIENWQREVRENYFPLSLEKLINRVSGKSYKIIYFNEYILPFTYNTIKNDFGIELKDNTHVKIILQRLK